MDDYVRYRPTYPAAALDLLERECGLRPGATVADLGAGTGILTALLLDRGARVFAVEPNEPMRRAAEARLGDRPGFASVAGTAEATGLPAASVDLVTAAQAFHWFDPPRARAEAARILRPGGRAAILWNDRRKGTTPFLAAYEELLLAWGTDYREVDHTRIGPAQLAAFFAGAYQTARLDNHQHLDREALLGRLRSSSYFPAPGHPRHAAAIAAAEVLFAAHGDSDGRVEIEYDTRVHWGAIPFGLGGL
ncbi:MAG TPA: class I SAM-dependent methyltransferase [Thermoanaerobaculia bacterium]|nr:class I SAM-dependent methyltransferase [Thermoanaerobaculia bacterium]